MRSNTNNHIDVFLNDTVYHNKPYGFYIEAGAYDGKDNSITYSYQKLGWKGILVQPNPETFKKCVLNRSSSNTFFNCALGIQEGTITMTIPVDNYQNGSIILSQAHKKMLNDHGCGKSYKEIQVPTIPFSTIVSRVWTPKIDLCIIDIQGYQNMILPDLLSSTVIPDILVIQHDWSDKQQMKQLVKDTYDMLKQFPSDYVFIRKDLK